MVLVPSDPTSLIDYFAFSLSRNFRVLPRNRKTRKKKNTKKNRDFLDVIATFDIECTNVPEIQQSFMYIWQMDFYIDRIHHVILGRTWDQFKHLLEAIKDRMQEDQKMMVFVHNLSYEFCWLTGLYKIFPDDVFCLNKRRIGKLFLLDTFEIRCSYVLTNLKLSKFAEEMGTRHRKLEGEKFDYKVKRTPGQALKRYELNYCIMDIVCLSEAIRELLDRYSDDLYSIPLTATGYIRREAKKALNKVSYKYRLSIQPTLDVFIALQEAFRGGDTHGNRYYAGSICENVGSYDRSSSYPEVMVNRKFPKNAFSYIGEQTEKSIVRKIKNHNMALLMRCRFLNIRLKDRFEASPYLPIAKTRGSKTLYEDNGRILEAEGWIEITITDVDLRIIVNQYEWDDFYCPDCWCTVYDYLPQPFRDLLIQLYKEKTAYKGKDPVIYQKAKQNINACYGMVCMNPIQDEIKYIQDDILDPYHEEKVPEDKMAEVLEKYGKKGFIPYQVACWVTAYARLELFIGSRIVTKGNSRHPGSVLLYMDTDSLKFFKDEDDALDPDFTEYNERKIKLSTESGMFATDPKGVVHYAGVYEWEGSTDYFRTWGAKKYCTQDKDGHVKLTLAGVPKAKGSRELERKGGIEKFTISPGNNIPGFIFEDAGLSVKYNDHVNMDYEINGEKIHIINNVYLYTDTYELGITDKYDEAILIAKSILQQDGYDVIF